jgi:hypothetical protein
MDGASASVPAKILSISALTRSISSFNAPDGTGWALSCGVEVTRERENKKVTVAQTDRHSVRIITPPMAAAVY